MAGKIVADIIESAGSQISLNVGNVTILTASSTGLTLIPTTNVNVNLTNSIVTLTNGSATSPGLTFSGNTRTGLFMPSANTLAFTAANTESMRIDSAGNFLIGTTTAYANLVLKKADGVQFLVSGTTLGGRVRTDNSYAYFEGVDYTGTASYQPTQVGGSLVSFATGSTERMRITSAGYVGIATQTSSLAMLEVRSNDTTIPQLFLQQDNTVHGWIQYADRSDGGIKFYRRDNSGSTERMRIDTNGAMMLGSSISGTFGLGGYFFVRNASGPIGSFSCQNSATALGFGNQSGTATYNAIYFYTNAYGTNVGGIAVNSASTSYNTTSDYRLKESILPMTGALARVSALKPVTYKWKPDDSDGEGFIAHELAEVCPHAVTGEKDAVDEKGDPKYQQVDVSFLVATLTAAIQELKVIVDAQAVEIAALKAK